MDKIHVLHSGGLDSTLCLLKAIDAVGPDNVTAISFNYGQKHSYETDIAEGLTHRLGVDTKRIVMPDIFSGSKSSLLNKDVPLPAISYEELQAAKGVSPTYVPFRNGIMLSLATALALIDGAQYLYYGAHSEDARNWAYPDCTPEFNGAMANAMYVGTYHKVRLLTPLQFMTKADVVRGYMALYQTSIAYSTWSCYRGPGTTGKHCGICPTCLARKAAFAEVGLVDLTGYEV